MPIHYDIETDELYLEGMEKGIEKGAKIAEEIIANFGIEKAILAKVVIRLLRKQKFTVTEIAEIVNVTEEFVRYLAEKLGLKVIH